MRYLLLVWTMWGNGHAPTVVTAYPDKAACVAAGKEWGVEADIGGWDMRKFKCIPTAPDGER